MDCFWNMKSTSTKLNMPTFYFVNLYFCIIINSLQSYGPFKHVDHKSKESSVHMVHVHVRMLLHGYYAFAKNSNIHTCTSMQKISNMNV